MKNSSDPVSDHKDGKKIVIAGAGCAGLAAGIALLKRGYSVTILEKDDHVGGLAGGIKINGNTYEYGPHIFHTTDPEILYDVKQLAGKVLMKFNKTMKIKFLDKYFDFPLALRDVLFKLPIKTVLLAGFSFIFHFFKGLFEGNATLVNSEKVLERYYGRVLYEIFFKDYITKVWGIEPSGLAPGFAEQRVPKLDLLKFFSQLKIRLFGKSKKIVSTVNYVEKVEGENYTTKEGFALIAESFRDEFIAKGGVLHLNHTVKNIHVEENTCKHVDGFECNEFISTVPISLLPAIISPREVLSDETRSTALALRFRGIVFVGILVGRKNVLPASFMYFRDKSFNRITDLGQFEVEIKPEGSTILIAEITCQPEDGYWKNSDETKKIVLDELTSEGLITNKEVLEVHIFKAVHGYPIYSVGYERHLKTVLLGLNKIKNLHTIGRQGRFAYINTHVAMKMGYEVAKEINREINRAH